MSLWGDSDLLVVPGFVDGTTVTIVGTATSEYWTAAGAGVTNAPLGSVATFGDIACCSRTCWFWCSYWCRWMLIELELHLVSSLTGAHRMCIQ